MSKEIPFLIRDGVGSPSSYVRHEWSGVGFESGHCQRVDQHVFDGSVRRSIGLILKSVRSLSTWQDGRKRQVKSWSPLLYARSANTNTWSRNSDCHFDSHQTIEVDLVRIHSAGRARRFQNSFYETRYGAFDASKSDSSGLVRYCSESPDKKSCVFARNRAWRRRYFSVVLDMLLVCSVLFVRKRSDSYDSASSSILKRFRRAERDSVRPNFIT